MNGWHLQAQVYICSTRGVRWYGPVKYRERKRGISLFFIWHCLALFGMLTTKWIMPNMLYTKPTHARTPSAGRLTTQRLLMMSGLVTASCLPTSRGWSLQTGCGSTCSSQQSPMKPLLSRWAPWLLAQFVFCMVTLRTAKRCLQDAGQGHKDTMCLSGMISIETNWLASS